MAFHISYKDFYGKPGTIDVVFYDVTTFAFESVKQDDLRDFGYSKDNKYNEVQVVMGMLIDCEGCPIGYELYKGSTFNRKTMAGALENLKKHFGIRHVVIVADKGLNSKINLKLIRDAGYGYIVASRIKNMSQEIQQQVLENEGYSYITGPCKLDGKPEPLRYKILDYVNKIKDEQSKEYELREHLQTTKKSNRKHRGLYIIEDKLLNADCVGAYNIMKKYLQRVGKPITAVVGLDTPVAYRWDFFHGFIGSTKLANLLAM